MSRSSLRGLLAVLRDVLVCVLVAPTIAHAQPPSASPMHLNVCGDHLYFSADDGVHGRELWRADENGTCRIVADINRGPANSNPEFFSPLGSGKLMFSARTPAHGAEPWAVDDALGVAWLLGDLFPGPASSSHNPIAATDDRYLVTARVENGIARALLVGNIDGGPTETLIAQASPGMYDGAPLGDRGAVCAGGDNLWYSNGSVSGTRTIFRFSQDNVRVVDNLLSLGDRVIFRAFDRDHGMEPWVTDGTPAGTHLLEDIASGPDESAAGQFTRIGSMAYFQADDGVHGLELWTTDGTPEGTRMIRDINPGRPSSDPHYFVRADDVAYFCADDGEHGIELWRTDGTEPGTVLAADVYPGLASGQPWGLCAFQDRMYFCALTPGYGEEIYSVAPGETAPALLRDIAPGPVDSGPDNLTNFKDRVLFFSCNDGDHGEELWLTEGHGLRTRMAADINAPHMRTNPSSNPHGFVSIAGRVVFAARDVEQGDELWCSDGTEAGTMLLADLAEGSVGSSPEPIAQLDRVACFAATHTELGRELFVTDGTPSGTRLLKDISEGRSGSSPALGAVIGGAAYFRASDAKGAYALWRTDGTAEGTVSAGAFPEGADGEDGPDWFSLFDRAYVYVHADGARAALYTAAPHDGAVQWSPDDEAASAIVRELRPPGGADPQAARAGTSTCFARRTPGAGAELWKSDGTSGGTVIVRDIYPGAASSSPGLFVMCGTLVHFTAEFPNLGRVLCRTDGAAEGTYAITPLNLSTGLMTSAVNAYRIWCVAPGQIAATASYGQPGGAWRIVVISCEGNREVLSHEIPMPPVPPEGRPNEMVLSGGHLLFPMNDGEHGTELWGIDLSTVKASLVMDIAQPGAGPENE